MKIKKQDIKAWLGGTGNFTVEDLLTLVTEIANGEYEVSQLKQDIQFYKDI